LKTALLIGRTSGITFLIAGTVDPSLLLFRQNEGKPNELRELKKPDRVCLQLLVFSG
jgi:hypothetical protein